MKKKYLFFALFVLLIVVFICFICYIKPKHYFEVRKFTSNEGESKDVTFDVTKYYRFWGRYELQGKIIFDDKTFENWENTVSYNSKTKVYEAKFKVMRIGDPLYSEYFLGLIIDQEGNEITIYVDGPGYSNFVVWSAPINE